MTIALSLLKSYWKDIIGGIVVGLVLFFIYNKIYDRGYAQGSLETTANLQPQIDAYKKANEELSKKNQQILIEKDQANKRAAELVASQQVKFVERKVFVTKTIDKMKEDPQHGKENTDWFNTAIPSDVVGWLHSN